MDLFTLGHSRQATNILFPMPISRQRPLTPPQESTVLLAPATIPRSWALLDWHALR